MGIGLATAAGSLVGPVGDIIDKLFTSDDERMAAKIKLMELERSGELAQIAVNTEEAKHESLFVAGWRPYIGWVCGIAYTYIFILQPFLIFAALAIEAVATGQPFPVERLPELDTAGLFMVLGGILGLGGLRTYEKKAGVTASLPPAPAKNATAGKLY